MNTPEKFSWPCCPEATNFVADVVYSFTENHNFAQSLSRRMLDETSTCLFDWTDHLRVGMLSNDFNIWLTDNLK